MITRYYTKTGSIYEVDDVAKKIRQVQRSDECKSGRVAAEWRPYKVAAVLHGCLAISWGTGRDEHSTAADQVGADGAPDASVTRHTHTSPVVRTEIVGEA